jgi:hypothetical protein
MYRIAQFTHDHRMLQLQLLLSRPIGKMSKNGYWVANKEQNMAEMRAKMRNEPIA